MKKCRAQLDMESQYIESCSYVKIGPSEAKKALEKRIVAKATKLRGGDLSQSIDDLSKYAVIAAASMQELSLTNKHTPACAKATSVFKELMTCQLLHNCTDTTSEVFKQYVGL